MSAFDAAARFEVLTERGSPAMTDAVASAPEPAIVPIAPILTIEDLHVHFVTGNGTVRAVEGLSYSVRPGEIVAIVGESGSGKSVSALAVMRLLPPNTARIKQGRILFNGKNLLALDDEAMRQIRGRDVAMIFQEPMTSLNPVLTIGLQIMEPLLVHMGMSEAEAEVRVIELLTLVGITDPKSRLAQYPHQLSGGMRQRVMIAIGLTCNPKLLIADEPTTALDVTIQAQILDLMLEMKERTGAAVMLITHDLGVIAETAQRIIVMYAGRKVEEASAKALFARPRHPYTRGLMTSIPRLNRALDETARATRLTEIPGMVPSLIDMAGGCTFAPRCAHASEQCRVAYPPEVEAAPGHFVACWNADALPEMVRA